MEIFLWFIVISGTFGVIANLNGAASGGRKISPGTCASAAVESVAFVIFALIFIFG